MPVSDYPSKNILVGFFIQEQEAGTVAERDQFSQELFDKFNQHIVDACLAATPPLDASADARSLMALMAQHAPGGTGKKQAQNAVAAYLEYRGW